MQHPVIQQYQYHKWANDRVFDHLKSLPAQVYDNEIKSVFSSIQVVLGHIYQTDGMWLSVMSGDEFSQTLNIIKKLKEKSTGINLSEMRLLYEDMNKQYFDFLENHDDLDKKLTISHPKYGDLDTSVTDMTKHIVNHGTYHRGNITAMLRQQEQKGVPTDYIFYLYELEKSS